jgi:hypothetical protein
VFALSAMFYGIMTPSQRVVPLAKNIQYLRISFETRQTKLKDKEGCNGDEY